MIQNRERIYLNIVKGIAVLLMLWGHAIQVCAGSSFSVFENSMYQLIYSFHMPLFMLVSGYLFFFSYQKRDLKTLLIHRAQGMLQPIFFATVLNNLLMGLPTMILHRQIQITGGVLLNGLYILWFLWSVLAASTVVAVAGKITENPWIRLLLLICGIFVIVLFPEHQYHLYMYPYFVAGFYFGMYRDKLPGWIFRCAWISLIVFPLLVGKYESWHLIYESPVYYAGMDLKTFVKLNSFRWLIGFAGSCFVLVITDAIVKYFYEKERMPAVLVMLGKLGENSLAIYCISISLFSYYLSKFYDRFLVLAGRNIFAENMVIYNLVFTPLLTLAGAFGLYAVVLIMKKIRIHGLIFGR